jgi:hypothetical protein
VRARGATGEAAVAAGAEEGASAEPLSPVWAAGVLAYARAGSAGSATMAPSTHMEVGRRSQK